MFNELQILAWACLLGIAQLLLAAQFSTKQRGMEWNISARDTKAPELTGIAGRLDRAFKNFMETFVFFAAAVLIVEARQTTSDISLYGSLIYLIARTIYVFIYAAGIKIVRTVVWFVSLVGLLMVLSQALL
jgi:uncharacterized MAPEG superfamily protein